MSRNRKIRATRRARAALKMLCKRQRIFDLYDGRTLTILKGRKPGGSSLHFGLEAGGLLRGTFTGRIYIDQPVPASVLHWPRVANNLPIQSMIAEQYDMADLEKRVAAMLGCEVSEIGQSIHIYRG